MCARSPQKCIDPFDVFLLPGNSWQWFFRPDGSCRKACRKCMRIMVQVVATQIICLFSSRTLGKNDPIWLAHIFEMGWFNHPFCLLKFEQDRCPDACWWDERYIYLPEKSSVFFVWNLEPPKNHQKQTSDLKLDNIGGSLSMYTFIFPPKKTVKLWSKMPIFVKICRLHSCAYL